MTRMLAVYVGKTVLMKYVSKRTGFLREGIRVT